jgi:cytochrome c oxidase subunit 5b
MFNVAVRALRPATFAIRPATRPSPSLALRAFSSTPRASSGAPAPQLFGPGSKPGEVPTDELQATGLERFQLLGELEGVSAFDVSPLDSSRVGTKENPILVPSLVSEIWSFYLPCHSMPRTEG